MELCLAVVAGSGCFAFTSSSLPLSICAQETAELATGKNTLCLAQPYFLALRPSRNRRKPAADKVDALRLITLARDPIIYSLHGHRTYFLRVRTPRELSYERRRMQRGEGGRKGCSTGSLGYDWYLLSSICPIKSSTIVTWIR